ncbi:YihY/virulence factor BrkB family protein [Arsenicitalea aurantiaca]|uniref:YihY/virulence factor BrkB family protein n=1 Tax=Arsenicitalea aurantiaca TaxID=1783274 RepID=A0A433X8L3_9HYPH|nr:YihY/virulence factor BrkB family protein [Arsenicitalea aurantiaca]RUT30394.1 YihY/virulence factor BrkB family protein [Arsenicitalea aurantiaca]
MVASAGRRSAERGREADTPIEVPPRGWQDILIRTYGEIAEDRVMLVAAAVTYYLLLSIVPAITAFISVYGLFTDPATAADHVQLLANVVPAGGLAIIEEQVTRLAASGDTTLGVALLISLGIALWSASAGVRTLFEAMNIAHGEREKRNFFVLNAQVLAFTLGGVFAATLLLIVAIAVPVGLEMLGLGMGLEWVLQIGAYLVLALALLTGIALLYRFGPSREQPKWRWVTPGAVFAVVAILVVSVLFSWYAANFANYEATYGSLGGLIGLLTWMWVAVTVLIIGAELNAEAEHQTARDSTTGPADPMGKRGAAMADTLGRSTGGRPDPREDRDRSPEWIEGYNAAKGERPRPKKLSLGALVFTVPAALALGVATRRKR